MRRIFALAAGALLIGGTMASTAAEARPGGRHWHGGYGGHHRNFYGHQRHWGGYRHYGYGYRRRGNRGAAVAAGIAGALIGGAIAAQQPRYPAYGYGYGPPAYYGY